MANITGNMHLTPAMMCTIASEPVTILSAQTQHGVDRATGTATITVDKPSGVGDLYEIWLNRAIEVHAGYAETGGAQRIFFGRVDEIAQSYDNRVRLRCSGWSKLLDFESEDDVVFPGGTTLYEIVRSLCSIRNLPLWGGERIRYHNTSSLIALGGVDYFDGGTVTIPRRTSWLQWIVSTLRLFGYRAFDRPDGYFWWQRVSGLPGATETGSYWQSIDLLDAERVDGLRDMATWFDVTGASGTDSDGVAVKIRSFPAVVPPDTGEFVTPPGYRRQPLSSNLLVNQTLADEVRNVHELSYSVPYELDTWRSWGRSGTQPGDAVVLNSERVQVAGIGTGEKRWSLTVDHSISGRGMRTTWTGWAGGGTALTTGIDTATYPVITTPVHLGDETLAHYAVPAPAGKTAEFTVSIPDEYTAVTLEGKAHGCNSYMLSGANAESQVSKLEVWQGGGDKPLGTANLPALDENLAAALDYTNPANWTSFRIPIPGHVMPGVVTIKVVAGEDSRAAVGFRIDDFELDDVNIVLTGVGSPSLPAGGS